MQTSENYRARCMNVLKFILREPSFILKFTAAHQFNDDDYVRMNSP